MIPVANLVGNALERGKDPLNVPGNDCDYSGGYDEGASRRTALNWGLV